MKHRSLFLAMALLVCVGLLLGTYVTVDSQTIRQRFEWVLAKRLTVDGAAAVGTSLTTGTSAAVGTSLMAGTTITAGTSLAAGTDVLVGNNLVIDNFLSVTPAAVITVSNGSTITPTASYQPLAAAEAAGTAAIVVQPAGTALILVNGSANTITLTDTGTLKLASNAVLAQYDTLRLLSDGTNWLELGRSDN